MFQKKDAKLGIYGPERLNRFIAIVFKNDPWTDSIAAVSFLGEGNDKIEKAYCSFSYQISTTSPYVPRSS